MQASSTPLTHRFLLAAREAEIEALKQLAVGCQQAILTGRLIHELQRERGISNVFLASGGECFARQYPEQVARSRVAEQAFRQGVADLMPGTGSAPAGMRLCNCIAAVLLQLEELDLLRDQVQQQQLEAATLTCWLSELIARLLAVIFELADSCGNPELTRALVATFNFIQGKEYAGQERAWGAIGFVAGQFEAEQLERLINLQDAQQRSFDTFACYAEAEPLALWHKLQATSEHAELLRLRGMFSRLQPKEEVPMSLSELWYELATCRIDRMQQLEAHLEQLLLQKSRDKTAAAEAELRHHRQQLNTLIEAAAQRTAPVNLTPMAELLCSPGHEGGGLNDTVYDLLLTQARHLEQVQKELELARSALDERKQIERAKGLLMQFHGLSEEQAYRQMRQQAMQANIRLVDLAARLIAACDGLGKT